MSKEELLKQVELLKEKQKEESELIEKLQKQIEDIEKEDKIWWTPSEIEVDDYYYIDGDGSVGNYRYDGSGFDMRYKNNLNTYKTKEQAERVAFEQLLHRKLIKFAFENNDKEIDWSNYKQDKFSIAYACHSNDLFLDINTSNKKFGQVYFTSVEIVEKAIKEFKKDLIRYFTTSK